MDTTYFVATSENGVANSYTLTAESVPPLPTNEVSLLECGSDYMTAFSTTLQDSNRGLALYSTNTVSRGFKCSLSALNEKLHAPTPTDYMSEVIADIDFGLGDHNTLDDILYVVNLAARDALGAGLYQLSVHLKAYTLMQLYLNRKPTYHNVRIIVAPQSHGDWPYGRPFTETEAFAFLVRLQLLIYENLEQDGYQLRTYKGNPMSVQNGLKFEWWQPRLFVLTPTLLQAPADAYSTLNSLLKNSVHSTSLRIPSEADWPVAEDIVNWVHSLTKYQHPAKYLFHAHIGAINKVRTYIT